ncbi:probable UDP-N-acetylglucosamine-peptide N-acetylglucosam at N-terminal half [Coccomyxa sp. Obi]|nr:probable UDP-N-acetylglucosamine-peptide N-acetylglucosam at N-terminal half [Coccomyxa sp. Obi]
MEEHVKNKDFSSIIIILDNSIEEVSTSGRIDSAIVSQIYCNRGLCHQRLHLNRKALKDYDEALRADPSNILALLRKGEVLTALKKCSEAKACWEQALRFFSVNDDLALLERLLTLLEGRSEREPGSGALQSAVAAPVQAASSTQDDIPSPAASVPATKAHQSVSANGPQPAQQPPARKQSAQRAANGAAKQPSALVRAACLDPGTGVSIAVGHVNEGNLSEALDILDHIIATTTGAHLSGAHVARGTARAMMRDLQGAIEDFSVTIEAVPAYGDAWMRRGQARAALGDDEDALADLARCLSLSSSEPARQARLLICFGSLNLGLTAEARLERGKILHKQRNYRAAVAELQRAVDLNPHSKQAWNFLGLCQVSMGDIRLGAAAYERVLRMDPDNLEAWMHLAQARKEEASVAEAEAAFARAAELDRDGSRASARLRMHAHMCQGLGRHRRAAQLLRDALEASTSPDAIVECLHLRGACHHAVGEFIEAVANYERAFSMDNPDLGEDARSRQFLSFYQREMALYALSRLDDPVADYCVDCDLHPIFKELWCKKLPPTAQLLSVYKLQALPPGGPPPAPPRPPADDVARLIRHADALGKLLQYRHQGFLANARQQRMAGLAIIELAQTLRHLVAERAAGRAVMGPEGASGSAAAHPFGWRDAMDIIVKWRQLSEPNDQARVIWVDLLTREEFEAGFGSHTPIYSGQTKCVRYYMNFDRGFALLKSILAEEGKAYDAQNEAIPLAGEHKQSQACPKSFLALSDSCGHQQCIAEARSAEDMWRAIGTDSWIVVPIASAARPGHTMEGTRLTLVKLRNQPDAYEFSIKTPVTPSRWDDYDTELSALWENVVGELAAGNAPGLARAALTFAYFWYNFMPLARGTAAAGYVAILAIFLAAGMPVTSPIPKAYQVDWEAILARSADPFIASVSPWLYPPAARGEPRPPQPAAAAFEIETLPAVKNVLSTARRRLDALNAPQVSLNLQHCRECTGHKE